MIYNKCSKLPGVLFVIALLFFTVSIRSFAQDGETITACAQYNAGHIRIEDCDIIDSSGCLASEYCFELERGSTIPDGMIAFFAGDCPAGWIEYEAARGLAIVGVPAAGTLPDAQVPGSGTQGTPMMDLEDRTDHTHDHNHPGINTASGGTHTHGGTTGVVTLGETPGAEGTDSLLSISAHVHGLTTSSSGNHDHPYNVPSITSDAPETPDVNTNEDVLPYIQLRACIKQTVVE